MENIYTKKSAAVAAIVTLAVVVLTFWFATAGQNTQPMLEVASVSSTADFGSNSVSASGGILD